LPYKKCYNKNRQGCPGKLQVTDYSFNNANEYRDMNRQNPLQGILFNIGSPVPEGHVDD
jgi:hypothetical protein